MGAASGLALALASATGARADGAYVGDFAVGDAAVSAAPPYANTGATVWTGDHDYSTISNPAGASILNEGAASGDVTANGGVIRNAPAGTWDGDISVGANVAGANVVNEGAWAGALNNAGGGLDNSGSVTSVNNAAGVFANEGTVSGDVFNGAQATNAGTIAGHVVNQSQFINNAAGIVDGGLSDKGSTTNNGAIAGGVTESGAFTNNATGLVGGGFALTGGSAVNNGAIGGGVTQSAGGFTDNGVTKGGLTVEGASASFTENGALFGGATVKAGSLVVNSAGSISGDVGNSGSFNNSGAVHGSVDNAGAFENAGTVDGDLNQSGGQTNNDGTIKGDAAFRAGSVFNTGEIGGDALIGAKASMIDNGAIDGVTTNRGAFTQNATGVLKGALVNAGQAMINGDLAGGAVNRGEMVINAAGRVENGLINNGGSVKNAGVVTGGAVVAAGRLINSGMIEGGLIDAGLVQATGVISGPIVVTGALVVGDGTATGEKLTIAPGSRVQGAVTIPVNLATGQSNVLIAKGADVAQAKIDLTGNLTNPKGAYWGSLTYSDTAIALTDDAKKALAAASGPLYRYTDPDGTGLVQTINPGLGATASQIAEAAAVAFSLALAEPPADFERAPADPTPNFGAGAAWSRGFGAALTLDGDNSAGTGANFDATRLSTRLGGGQLGFEYGLHNIENSGYSLRLGVAGGDALGAVVDRAGSGAGGRVNMPFVGAYAALTGNGFTGRIEARYAAIDMRLTDVPLAVFDQTQHAGGMFYGAEMSYSLPLGSFYIEPSLGLRTASLHIADEATNVGALSFSGTRLSLGHAGLKLGGAFETASVEWRPYALGEIFREWRSGGTIAIPDGPTIASTGLQGFEQVGLGVNATLAHSGLAAFAQAAYAFGPNISGITATSGVKLDF